MPLIRKAYIKSLQQTNNKITTLNRQISETPTLFIQIFKSSIQPLDQNSGQFPHSCHLFLVSNQYAPCSSSQQFNKQKGFFLKKNLFLLIPAPKPLFHCKKIQVTSFSQYTEFRQKISGFLLYHPLHQSFHTKLSNPFFSG